MCNDNVFFENTITGGRRIGRFPMITINKAEHSFTIPMLKVKIDADGNEHEIKDITFVLQNEDEAYNRAADAVVVWFQGSTRRRFKNKTVGRDTVGFDSYCKSVSGTSIQVPKCGERGSGAKIAVSTVNKGAAQSMRDKYPGITSDELVEYLTTDETDKPALEAKFSNKYPPKK